MISKTYINESRQHSKHVFEEGKALQDDVKKIKNNERVDLT